MYGHNFNCYGFMQTLSPVRLALKAEGYTFPATALYRGVLCIWGVLTGQDSIRIMIEMKR